LSKTVFSSIRAKGTPMQQRAAARGLGVDGHFLDVEVRARTAGMPGISAGLALH
jgi:hypothetical protein